ncbi:MAG TPA: S-layer homology domain-containing protein [Symbiobacteriaceae bacterium]|nr:S-layer homology domain-containing protein [Symbiobacteriaceae bacterium]
MICLILLGLSGQTVLGAGPGGPQFSDVTDHWALASIEEASGRGIVTGYPDGTFRPGAALTRAAFVTMLARTLGLPPDTSRLPVFPDAREHWVGTGGWLEAAYSVGILQLSDYPQAQFGPDVDITREEIAVMVTRALLGPGTPPASTANTFADAGSVAPWRLPYVAEAAKRGLITGYPDGTFRPANRATRAEAVVIALRVAGARVAGPGPGPGPGPGTRPPVEIKAAPDKLSTWTLGPVSISTHNPVTWIQGLDTRLNLFFTLENKGASPATLRLDNLSDLRGPDKPSWLSAVLGYSGIYRDSIELAPGETETFELHLSSMWDGKRDRQTVPFKFRLVQTGEIVTLPLDFIINPDGMLRDLGGGAVLTGRVTTPSGAPVAGAMVTLYFIHGGNTLRTTTGADGGYRIDAPPLSDLQTLLGPRPQPHPSEGYTVLVDAAGYGAWFQDGIALARGQQTVLNAQVQPAQAKLAYRLVAEHPTDGRYGYWWTKFLGATNRAVTVQGQHPPQLGLPGHILGLDMQGRELWRIPTGNECWALDTSADGQLIAAGCHDGNAYVADANGKLLWKKAVGGELYGVRFSPDSTLLLVDRGPKGENFGVYQARSGELVWTPGEQLGQVRGARWSSDGQRLATAHNEGEVRMWTRDGKLLWRNFIGEVPFEFEMDGAYNVYGGGKTQYISSLDGTTGALRWRRYMDSTANEAVRHMTAAGDVLMVDSFNGLLHALDPATGKTLWQRQLPAVTGDAPHGTGHNAFDMTADGGLMVVGTRGYDVEVYDRTGALLWHHMSSQRSDFPGDPSFHGHYTGALSVAISPDGRYIVAGYADSVVRVFEREQ